MASVPPHPQHVCVGQKSLSYCPVMCQLRDRACCSGPRHFPLSYHAAASSPTVQGPESLCLPPGSHSHHWSPRVRGPLQACSHWCPWEPGTGAVPPPWPKPASSFHALQPRDAQHPALLPGVSGGGGLPAVDSRWAGLGARQGRRAWTQFSSRMSGDWNSWPRRYTSRPWKQAKCPPLGPGAASHFCLELGGASRKKCHLEITGQHRSQLGGTKMGWLVLPLLGPARASASAHPRPEVPLHREALSTPVGTKADCRSTQAPLAPDHLAPMTLAWPQKSLTARLLSPLQSKTPTARSHRWLEALHCRAG